MDIPAALIRSLQHVTGFQELAFCKVHKSGEQSTSIRLNPHKIFNNQFPVIGVQPERVPWCENGYYLRERPSFTLDPLFHAGVYYVQEASSMFLEQALKQGTDLSCALKVLDLCAAPGGKSTLMQSLLSAGSVLVSNEVIKSRVNVLAENITKWGGPNVVVCNNDPKDFQRLAGYFDVIVVDAPCSGSGLFRKDQDSIKEWSENNVQLCSQRQQRILADIMPALKERGLLIYSTCSYSPEEDEDIADWLMANFPLESVQLSVQEEWNIVETRSPGHKAYGYRFFPDKVRGEGFFITLLKDRRTFSGEHKQTQIKNSRQITTKEISASAPYLKNPSGHFFFRQNDDIIAWPEALKNDLASLQDSLYLKKAGIKTGTVIREEMIPHHELAMSTIVNERLPAIELDEKTALQYLRRQEIKLDHLVMGWALVKFRHLPLGWVKILPHRINNYYPKNWRILNK